MSDSALDLGRLRFAVDTGGTFTDLVVETERGELQVFKDYSTPHDPLEGILGAFDKAAAAFGTDRKSLLGSGSMLVHATTWAINAIVTGARAETALLVTEGHPDLLLFREGGRREPFNNDRQYPDPYVKRSLTFEIGERVLADGRVAIALDEDSVVKGVEAAVSRGAEAIAVCLLWSIINPAHEKRVGDIIADIAPDIPYTLSHELNPTIREYRRAASAAIDASLKPTMTRYFDRLTNGLGSEGFDGRLLVVSSNGGVLDAPAVATAPIHAINSGPAMAPVAGRAFARIESGDETVIIADTGGTTFDVSLVRHGRIPQTRETYLGEPGASDLTGFPSVDVRSVGAGGGTIAWVDGGGLLRFGPNSAGAAPGPACYGRGGTAATLTDACLVAGYLDPDSFLGGAVTLDLAAAEAALQQHVGAPLGLSVEESAEAVISLATEQMALAIESITVDQGVDPRQGAIIGGGGAAGLNLVAIARRLQCPTVLIPAVGSALSAAGALLSDISAEFSSPLYATTADADIEQINGVLAALESRCEEFFEQSKAGQVPTSIDLVAEARYPHQVWELDVPIAGTRFHTPDEFASVASAFHELHETVFATSDRGSDVELLAWRMRANSHIANPTPTVRMPAGTGATSIRPARFLGHGALDTSVYSIADLTPGTWIEGPALVEMILTTVVIDPGARATVGASGSLLINTMAGDGQEGAR